MILFKILLMVLFCCVLPVVIVLKIWVYFVTLHTEKKTYYITTELHFNDVCLIQGEDNWIVCYADSHAFTDKHYFQTEQEACEFFFHYYFYLV